MPPLNILYQDEHLVAATRVDSVQLLVHRVGRALVPVSTEIHCLLGGQQFDETAAECIECVGATKMSMETD